jgi:hypothetical protein
MLGAGCVTVRIVDFPPPEGPCADEDDVKELARLLPNPKDDAREAIRIEALGQRFITSAAYCQEGEETLR